MSKRYLLIGASHGIGKELAKKLLSRGNSLDIICRSQSELLGDVHFHEADVCNFEQTLPDLPGPFDGLAYLPGTINLAPFAKLTLDDFRHDFEINHLGAVRVLQKYLPQLNENSSIVLMSSIAATLGLPYHSSIASAKAAITGLTRSLAAELAPKIRVNAVAPSLTATRMSEHLLSNEARREHAAERHLLHSYGQPKDQSDAIAYLLSEEARWITGQVLHVDGGLSTLRLI